MIDETASVRCGYGLRVVPPQVKEAVATIAKAMVQINELSKTMSPLNINQMTRWVDTTATHTVHHPHTVHLVPFGALLSPVRCVWPR